MKISKYLITLISFLVLYSVSIKAQSNDDCLSCHSDKEISMEKKGKTISLYVDEKVLKNSTHKNLKCIQCHSGFNAEEIPHKEKIEPINCLTCHSNAGVKHQFHPGLIKATGKETSQELSCKACHGTHNVSPISSKKAGFNRADIDNYCAKCHKSQTEKFQLSAHYEALKSNNEKAPGCLTCHKENISSKDSKVDTLQLKLAQEKLCLNCHLEMSGQYKNKKNFIADFENSVHGKALQKGNSKAATCIDCHNSHDIINGIYSNSSLFKLNISKTCQKCHPQEAKEYDESAHGVALQKRNMDSPTCTNCHGEHNILKAKDPNSPVSFQNVSAQVCSPCHSSVKLSERYGFSAKRVQSFVESYHGLALRGGSVEVANCASCHGYHNIKNSQDSTSTIHKSNLAATCGKCHPGAGENFTVGKIHVIAEDKEEPILYWISFIYIILIASIIGGMFVHNILDFYRKAKIKFLQRRGYLPVHHYGHSLYLRMSLSERIQHASLMISFFTLVITGFMLRFPEAWWVTHIRDFIPGAFELRSLVHRIAAVVMVAASLYHLYYILFTTRGRKLIIDLLPNPKDFKDAIGVLKFNLGISKVKPKLDRFSYIEKSEYWALVWGTIVMTLTGIIMWFENYFINQFTKLGWDIARTIHYYEAWLAFLAIVVWHIYFVIFNPDAYPMNLAWIKGTITEEEMAEEHPLELERIKKKQAEEEKKPKEDSSDKEIKN